MKTFNSLAAIQAAKTSELLEFYNSHCTPIVKFRDRASAERRAEKVLNSFPKPAIKSQSPIVSAATSVPPKNAKTYVAIIRDHSGSMYSLESAAKRDFNSTLGTIQRAAASNNITTLGSVYKCGGAGITLVESQKPISDIQQISSYTTGGGTPLFKTVLRVIEDFKRVPDYSDPETTFIVLATTDGHDTNGGQDQMTGQIRELQNTDRWTFAFRVPRGYGRELTHFGIQEGNILEWDQTDRGMATASQANDSAFDQLFTDRKLGVKSSKTFYSSLKGVTSKDVATVLADISSEVLLFPVSTKEDGSAIREFVEMRLRGQPMAKGAAFYALVKKEDKIQDYKLIAIRNKTSNAIYCGDAARDMLGLPRYGDARVVPQDHGNFDVFIQSTSVNRKVTAGTNVMYWPNVGVTFKEGKSARSIS